MSEQPQHFASDPEAPLRHIVANLEHLRGKGLPELVRAARWRRRRAGGVVAGQAGANSLAQVLADGRPAGLAVEQPAGKGLI